MNCLDYGASFLAGKWSENSVRFWVESRTRIIDERTGEHEDYLQCGSCKSENTFAERNLFQKDNYDFLPVFGPKWGIIFRRRAWLNENYRSCVKAADMWGGQVYHLVERPDAVELRTNAAVRDATAKWLPIVARTEIRDKHTTLRAVIEFPVKTMNIHPARNLYQVDSGPVALPDLSQRRACPVEGFRLAFVAFNAPDFVDFVVEVPTCIPGPKGDCMVYHYSELLTLPAVNTLWALPDRMTAAVL
jgi:hypothetical protein